MNRRRLLFLASGISLLALVGIYLLAQGHRITVASNEWNSPRFDRFYLTDVEYSQYEGAEKLYTVHVDEVTQRKWQIGPYTVNPIKEIKMTNLRIEVAERGAGTGRNTSGPSGLITFDDGFSIISNHGQELRARKGHWRPEDGVFVLPESYLLKDTAGTHEGFRAVFAVDPSGRIEEVEEAVWTSKAPLGE